jgi:hypothetical protein
MAIARPCLMVTRQYAGVWLFFPFGCPIVEILEYDEKLRQFYAGLYGLIRHPQKHIF